MPLYNQKINHVIDLPSLFALAPRALDKQPFSRYSSDHAEEDRSPTLTAERLESCHTKDGRGNTWPSYFVPLYIENAETRRCSTGPVPSSSAALWKDVQVRVREIASEI